MPYQSPQTTFNAGDKATVRPNLNANGAQVTNLLLTLRRLIQAGETLTIYTGEDLTHTAPYSVQGHVTVQGHLSVQTPLDTSAKDAELANLLLSLRRVINSDQSYSLAAGEELIHSAPYSVLGHVSVAGHLRITS